MGTTALISNALGRGDREEAAEFAGQALVLGIVGGIVVMFLGWWCAPTLFRWLGAEAEYLDLFLSYMNTIFAGSLFFMLTSVLNAPLLARGDTVTQRNAMVGAFFANLALDPWFIYGGFGLPPMGLGGVALATVLTHAMSMLYILHRLHRAGQLRFLHFRYLSPRLHYQLQLLQQGFPASLNMLTIAVGIFVVTWFVSGFGTVAVAAFGIACRIDQMAVLPALGLNTAALTLAGQNLGAGRFDRIRKTHRTCLRYGAWICGVGGLLVLGLARPLMLPFSRDPEVLAVGVVYLRIAAVAFYAYATLFITTSLLQGLKRPMFAVYIGIYRQILVAIPIYYWMSKTWGLPGLWWGLFLVNGSAALITLLYTRRVLRGLSSALE